MVLDLIVRSRRMFVVGMVFTLSFVAGFGGLCDCRRVAAQDVAAAKPVEVPAGAAQAVVAVVTESNGRIIAAETGVVVHRDDKRAYVFVEIPKPMFTPRQTPSTDPEYFALVAAAGGQAPRRIALEKTYVLAEGKTLFTAAAADLPAPLTPKAEATAKEGMTVLLVGCEIKFDGERPVPTVVVERAKVDRAYRDAKTLATHFTIETTRPLNLRSGLITSEAGALMAVAKFDPEKPRSTIGYRFYASRPAAELERVGDPELTYYVANFRIGGGDGLAEVAAVFTDPFGRLKNPRLLVTTRTKNELQDRMLRSSDMGIIQNQGLCEIKVRDGVWIDRAAGDEEVKLKPTDEFDPSFEQNAYRAIPTEGSKWIGEYRFLVPKAIPFMAQVVVDDHEGKMKPLAQAASLQLQPTVESDAIWMLPVWAGMEREPRLTPRPVAERRITSKLTKVAAEEPPAWKPAPLQPTAETKPVLENVEIGDKLAIGRLGMEPLRRPPMTASGDGKLLFLVNSDNRIVRVDTSTWNETGRVALRENCHSIAMSSEGLLASLLDKSVILVIDPLTLKEKKVIRTTAEVGNVVGGAKSPYFFVLDHKQLSFYDAAKGKALHRVTIGMLNAAGVSNSHTASDDDRARITLSSDGTYFFFGNGYNGRIRRDGEELTFEMPAITTHGMRINRPEPSDDAKQTPLPAVYPPQDHRNSVEIYDGFGPADTARLIKVTGLEGFSAMRSPTGNVFASSEKKALLYDRRGKLIGSGPTNETVHALGPRQVPKILVLPPGDRAILFGSALNVVDSNLERLKAAK